jgi:hypothetical protein
MSENNELILDSINKLFKTDNNNYIFIYTPPKVGSTTLVSSLRISLGKSYNVIHIHNEVMLSVLTGVNNVNINEIIQYLANIGKQVYVIDVYRTPIESKISSFFEKISPYHFNNTEENINKYSLQRVVDRFNKLFPHLQKSDHYFDKYIPIPPPFDFSKKYTIQEFRKVKYIKLRLCDSQLWSGILSTIFNTDIVLITDYKTEDKTISELYNNFKRDYKLPVNYFDDIKNCKYFNFYYNEEERKDYLNSWKLKLSLDEVVPYTNDEYKFYTQLCLENQYINDIQLNHYIDNGCVCKHCTKKRRDIFFKAKNGEKIFEKIIHSDVVQEEQQKTKKNILDVVNKKMIGQKFKPKQFTINVNHK